jgi:hypothetical protein
MTKVILVAAGILLGVIFWSINDVPDSRDINLVSGEVLGEEMIKKISGIGPSSSSYSNLPVIEIINPLDFGLLKEGQKFALIGNSVNGNQRLVLEVVSKNISSDFTLIKASTANGQTSIITVTDTFTKILIKTPDNVFEYSGEEFNGMVERVTDLKLNDDVYHNKAKETIFAYDEPLRKLSED